MDTGIFLSCGGRKLMAHLLLKRNQKLKKKSEVKERR
jgi:hypothetical protein